MTAPDPRPSLTPALDALVDDLIISTPALHGISGVLVVALGAHARAAASMRSLSDVARSVRVDGVRRHAELGLRPPFFHEGDAPRRLATLAHELLHLDRDTPGQLREENRHKNRGHGDLEKEARTIARAYLERAPPRHLLCLAHHGEVLLRTWLHRPVDGTSGQRFSDADLFEAPIHMATTERARGGWW